MASSPTYLEPTPENPEGYRPELLTPDAYPALRTLSAAHMLDAVIRPNRGPVLPLYVYVPCKPTHGEWISEEMVTLSEWNWLWECGHIRPDFLEPRVPERVDLWLERYHRTSFRFLGFPEGQEVTAKLTAYQPLSALLPLNTVRRFGLTPQRGTWPYLLPWRNARRPRAVDLQWTEQAFAAHVWPLLCPGSPLSSFTADEPVRLLAHSLDYWLPHMDLLLQRRAEASGRVAFDSDEQRLEFERATHTLDPRLDAQVLRPCFGIDAWSGEEEAWEATEELVETADQGGGLRSILDAIRSHRVQDDFSQRCRSPEKTLSASSTRSARR